MQFALRPLGRGIKVTILLPMPPAAKLNSLITLESGHLGPTTFFLCDCNGLKPTTRSWQESVCDDLGFAHVLVFHAQASQTSFTRYLFVSSINFWSFTNRPFAAFEYASGTSNRFPLMSTCGRVSSLVVGLEEAQEYGVGGGASTLLFTNGQSGGVSSELDAGEARDSLAYSSKEEVAMLSLSYERGSSTSKRRGEVDGGGGGQRVGGQGTRRFSSLPAKHILIS